MDELGLHSERVVFREVSYREKRLTLGERGRNDVLTKMVMMMMKVAAVTFLKSSTGTIDGTYMLYDDGIYLLYAYMCLYVAHIKDKNWPCLTDLDFCVRGALQKSIFDLKLLYVVSLWSIHKLLNCVWTHDAY